MTDHDLFGYGQWEPTFDPGTQCEGGCGYAPEHCRCPLPGQPTLDLGSSDLFGGAFARSELVGKDPA